MLDCAEYITEAEGYQGNGNGYNELEGDWALYYKVARGFLKRVKAEDKEDFLHDLFLAFARVKAGYDLKGKGLSKGGLVHIAQFEVAEYWRRWFRHFNGQDCGRCSEAQRKECKEDDLYRECPKAIRLESLNRLIEDGEGDRTEFYLMLADDNQPDLVAMLDAKRTLKGYPQRAVQIAYKQYAGYALTDSERNYLYHERKRVQKQLALV